MMNAKKIKFSIFSFILISVYATLCVGDVLFEDDFEGGVVDESKWIPTETWFLDGGVLHVNGGEVGITVRNDFTDFEFSVDFNMVDPLYAANFVVRAQDIDNCTLVQVVFDDRNQLWWFTRVDGGYIVNPEDQLANESGVLPELGVWYTMKIVAQGNRYELYLGEQGDEPGLACTLEDDTHSEGGVGFRAGGGEHCLYDNVLVTTVGSTTAVNPDNSLPVTWGKLKDMQ